MVITMAMTTPRRSFWAILGLAALADALAIGGALWAVRAVLPCWWAPARPAGWEPGAVCERTGWGTALHTWLPAIVLVSVALACLGTGVVLVGLQVVRARRISAGFGPPIAPGVAVAQAAAKVGVRRLVVVDDPRSSCCLCAGLFRTRVIVSTGVIGALSESQLCAVLAHEASHAHHRDPLLITLSRAAGAGLFFVPLARSLGQLAVARAELAADATAVVLAGRSALSGALLALDEAPVVRGAVAHVVSAEVIDLRIQALRSPTVPQPPVALRLLGAGVVILVALGLTVTTWVRPSNARAPLIVQAHLVSPSNPKSPLRVPSP